jgi:DNA polymerase III epsilon subunit-like protein
LTARYFKTGEELMTYLFLDTETTGLPVRWNAPVTDLGNWPRIVQVAWTMSDAGGGTVERKEYIIRPEGYEVPEAASRIHGITHERALREGVSLRPVLQELAGDLERAGTAVAHNMQFDEKVIAAEFLRAGIPDGLTGKKKICTMLSTVNYCELPGRFSSFKWPKLEELHTKLFGPGFRETHNAADDVATCVKCFFELKKLGIVG